MTSRAQPPDWGAGHYERTAEILRPAAEVLVAAAAPQPGERVLDIGSGTGSAALVAAVAGAEVVAVDPSDRLLRVAAASARELGVDLTCLPGPAAALPVPDSSVDCALSNFGIIFEPDHEAAVSELARVCRPGGRIALTAWLPGGGVGALASTAQELVCAALGAPGAADGFPWHDTGALRQLFSSVGLRVGDVSEPHELAFTATSPDAFLETELANHPMAVAALAVLQRHGEAERARQRMRQVLVDHNEVETGFQATSRYVVHAARCA